jgi:hypothetical protein
VTKVRQCDSDWKSLRPGQAWEDTARAGGSQKLLDTLQSRGMVWKADGRCFPCNTKQVNCSKGQKSDGQSSALTSGDFVPTHLGASGTQPGPDLAARATAVLSRHPGWPHCHPDLCNHSASATKIPSMSPALGTHHLWVRSAPFPTRWRRSVFAEWTNK